MTTTPIENKEFSPENSLKKPDFRQETRLGLVLYGGVSLAVYMNGVCREFYNAMRGRGIYKLIKALTDSDIVVDIVSGTSAGGINGVLLSYAIANSYEETVVDFEEFADIWRESGDINKLMRPVEQNKDEINSILDGKGYYQKRLFNAFQKAGINQKSALDAAPDGEWYSDFKELDLFITGTDVLGRVYKTFDNTGKVIEIKDHRSVFHLKYREDQEFGDPFSLTDVITQQALAKLCRITSCFPVAFPVVSVNLDPENKVSSEDHIDKKIDKKLEQWGNLLDNRLLPKKEPPSGYQLHFVDGGVLDNRPFSYTTEAIYYRTADRPVNRQLFYLDPNPDSFVGSPDFEAMPEPNIWKVLNDSLISLPRYESIGKDLQEIKESNDKIRRYKLLKDSIFPQSAETQINNGQTQSDDAKNRYLRTRLVALRDRVLPLLFDSKNIAEYSKKDSQQLLEETAKLLTGLITDEAELADRNEKLIDVADQIHYLDSQYIFRQHYFLLDRIFSLMNSTANKNEYLLLKSLANQISYIIELIKIIDEALQRMLSLEKVSVKFYSIIERKISDARQVSIEDKKEYNNLRRKESYEYLLGLFSFLLSVDSELLSEIDNNLKAPQDLLDFIVTRLQSKDNEDKPSKNIFKEIINPIYDCLNRKSKNLSFDSSNSSLLITHNDQDNLFKILEQVSKNLVENSNLPSEITKKLTNYLSTFDQFDQIIYPYEYLADIQGKDSIEVVRISPNDANKGFGDDQKRLDRKKLAGSQLGAFGGFFKKSWRSNDMMWGRLDGLNRIVDGLLTPESLKSFSGFVSRESQNQNLTVENYLRQLVNESFPNAIQGKDLLIEKLVNLSQPDTMLQESDLIDLQEQLVLLGHRVILKENLGNVFNDAMDEQLQWNQQRVAQQKSNKKPLPKFDPITGYFDQTITPFATQELAKAQIKELLKDQNKIDDYFLNTYRVGSETLTNDIPPNILQKLGAQTGIVFRNIIESTPVGKWLRRLKTYKIASALLNGYYQFVQKRKSNRVILIFLLLFILAAFIAWLLSLLAKWALVIVTTLILVLGLLFPLLDLLGTFFRKK